MGGARDPFFLLGWVKRGDVITATLGSKFAKKGKFVRKHIVENEVGEFRSNLLPAK